MKPPRWLRVYRVAIRDKLNFSSLYWSFKYDEFFGSKDEVILDSAGNDVATYTLRTNKDVDELLSMLACKK